MSIIKDNKNIINFSRTIKYFDEVDKIFDKNIINNSAFKDFLYICSDFLRKLGDLTFIEILTMNQKNRTKKIESLSDFFNENEVLLLNKNIDYFEYFCNKYNLQDTFSTKFIFSLKSLFYIFGLDGLYDILQLSDIYRKKKLLSFCETKTLDYKKHGSSDLIKVFDI